MPAERRGATGLDDAYEKMKELSRGENNFDIEKVINSLDANVKNDLVGLNFNNYIGYNNVKMP